MFLLLPSKASSSGCVILDRSIIDLPQVTEASVFLLNCVCQIISVAIKNSCFSNI